MRGRRYSGKIGRFVLVMAGAVLAVIGAVRATGNADRPPELPDSTPGVVVTVAPTPSSVIPARRSEPSTAARKALAHLSEQEGIPS